jgi:hypothetical protein
MSNFIRWIPFVLGVGAGVSLTGANADASPLLMASTGVTFDSTAGCGNGPSGTVGPLLAMDGCLTSVQHEYFLSNGSSLTIQYDRGGSGSASAGYGRLAAEASAYTTASGSFSASFSGGSGSTQTASIASMADDILFGSNMTGLFLALTVDLSGESSVFSQQGYDTVLGGQPIRGSADAFLFDERGNLVASSATATHTTANYLVPIFGSIAPFALTLQVRAICNSVQFAGDQCAANADYSHTAIISQMRVVDANGQAVDTPFTAASGFSYPTDSALTPVPEPRSILLVASGAVALLVQRRRRIRTGY